MKNVRRWERNHLKNLEKPFHKKQRKVMPKFTCVEKPKKGKGSYNRADWRKEASIDRSRIA